MVSRIACILLVVGVANAATWMGRLPPKPKEFAHKQGCYVNEINDVIPFGEEISLIGACYKIECSRHMIYYASCGSVSTDDPKCLVTGTDLKRPYPDCCPDIKCDLDNTIL